MSKEYSYGVLPYLIKDNQILLLLAKSNKKDDYGIFKGKIGKGETIKETAIREFQEESYLKIKEKDLEQYFYQENKNKDVGIYLFNIKNLKDFNKYFKNGILKEMNHENIDARWFKINKLPNIVKNQNEIIKAVVKYFTNKDN